MSQDGVARALGSWLGRLGPARRADGDGPLAPRVDLTASERPQVFATKALAKFLAYLAGRDRPVLLDLGPVVGPNVTYFGEGLGCKIFVEDLPADLDRHARDGRLAVFPGFLGRRFPQPDASVDGVLCWDVFDYLDRESASVLARELTRVLRAGGALLGFFSTDEPNDEGAYSKYTVLSPSRLKHRSYEGSQPRQRVLMNREIIRMFEGLRVSESFLLQVSLREMLFRKPALAEAPRSPR